MPLVLAAAVWGQNQPAELFSRAPKAVDDALRARMQEFYRDHVEGKYRQAEALVADDSKDFFYSSNKPKYLSFEIRSIQYSDDFAKAKATVLCEQYVVMPGFTNKPLKVPTPSYWKLENGQWYWYVDQEAFRQTPFGKVNPAAASSSVPALPSETEAMGLLAAVKADKEKVVLEKGKTAEVLLANTAPGVVMLSIFGKVPDGLDAIFDHVELKSKEKTALKLRARGTETPQGTIQVKVSPTNQIIPIQISSK
jgi:hypothetical protein